ncbi:MAG: DUF5011 domain-containing protein [Candidatus Magasanikbacteria bacterium]|nr:DUF5011 domain-containing protein [Candidatus Magasanikbacteria bacterium]
MASNTSTYATSSAFVIDTTAPVITLLGDATTSVFQSGSYTDAGATANDAIEGDLTSHINTSGSVNVSVPGTYTLAYTASDTAGNAAAAVIRSVTVIAVGIGATIVSPTASGADNNNFTVLVNGAKDDDLVVSSPEITFTFNANPTTVKGYAVSLNSAFSDASMLPYSTTAKLTLPNNSGIYTLYFKFYSLSGHSTNAIMKKVSLVLKKTTTTSSGELLKKATNAKFVFTKNLRTGMKHSDVRELQKMLNANGFIVSEQGLGSPKNETTYYGQATAKALQKFQEAHAAEILAPLGLQTGTGIFLNASRKFVNENFTTGL